MGKAGQEMRNIITEEEVNQSDEFSIYIYTMHYRFILGLVKTEEPEWINSQTRCSLFINPAYKKKNVQRN